MGDSKKAVFCDQLNWNGQMTDRAVYIYPITDCLSLRHIDAPCGPNESDFSEEETINAVIRV